MPAYNGSERLETNTVQTLKTCARKERDCV